MLTNIGSVGLRGLEEAPDTKDRGFHLLVLADSGEPRFYCKFRSASPQSSHHREARVLNALNSHPISRKVVPECWVARNERMEVQVAPFIRGRRLDHLIPELDESDLLDLVGRVLSAARALSRAASDLKEVFGSQGVLSLRDAASEALETLPLLGLSAEHRDILASGLEDAGTVMGQPQHRDLWPANVFITPEQECRIIDFDHFGDVSVPLYDAFHFVRTVMDQVAPTGGTTWVEKLWNASDHLSGMMRTRIAAEASSLSLSAEQVGGCLLYYLIDAPATVFHRGGPSAFWRRLYDELPAAAELLRESRAIESVGSRLLER